MATGSCKSGTVSFLNWMKWLTCCTQPLFYVGTLWRSISLTAYMIPYHVSMDACTRHASFSGHFILVTFLPYEMVYVYVIRNFILQFFKIKNNFSFCTFINTSIVGMAKFLHFLQFIIFINLFYEIKREALHCLLKIKLQYWDSKHKSKV